jgi:hypothetical protein
MSFQVSRILKHCYQLPSLASSLEIATQPYARAVVSTLGMDFRRGFAEVGGKSSPQPEASNPDSAAPEETAGSAKALENGLGQISQPRASSREPDPCDAPNLQAPTSAADEAKPPFASGGVLDFGELLDNTFKMLKSEFHRTWIQFYPTACFSSLSAKPTIEIQAKSALHLQVGLHRLRWRTLNPCIRRSDYTA